MLCFIFDSCLLQSFGIFSKCTTGKAKLSISSQHTWHMSACLMPVCQSLLVLINISWSGFIPHYRQEWKIPTKLLSYVWRKTCGEALPRGEVVPRGAHRCGNKWGHMMWQEWAAPSEQWRQRSLDVSILNGGQLVKKKKRYNRY